MKKAGAEKACSLCGSQHNITFHHLIPRTCHRNKWFKKNFSKTDMKKRGIDLCRQCHVFIHEKFSEKALGRELNTLEKIRDNDFVKNYVKWAKKAVN